MKTAGDLVDVGQLPLAGFVFEEHRAGIFGSRCEKQYAPSPLRESNARVSTTRYAHVKPSFRAINEKPHRVATVELKHEWDVLQQQPGRSSTSYRATKDFTDESRLSTLNPGGAAA